MTSDSVIFKLSFKSIEFGFGLTQRALIGSIKINTAGVLLVSKLHESIRVFKGDTKIIPYINSKPSSVSVVSQLCEIYTRLHLEARIPLFHEFKLIQALENREQETFVYNVSFPYWNIESSRLILNWLDSAILKGNCDIHNAIKSLGKFGYKDTNTMPLVYNMWKKSLFFKRFSTSTFQLGIGAQSSFLSSSLLDSTSGPMCFIFSHKFHSNQFLSTHGIPVPKQLLVSSKEAAIEASQIIGFPIVIKPAAQEQGRGVAAGILSSSEFNHAYDRARKYGKDIIVEEFCVGKEYRITMLHDEVLKIVRRQPPSIIGDGVSTIEQLIIQENKKNIDIFGRNSLKNPFNFKDETLLALKNQGLSLCDIPVLNHEVPIRLVANISRGGLQELIDISSVHLDNIHLFKRIATISRLGLCGIDIIFYDISMSWIHYPSHVIEINHRPQIGVRYMPEVYERIIDSIISSINVKISLVAYPPGFFPEVSSIVDNVKSLLPDIVDWKCLKHFTVTNSQLFQGSRVIFNSHSADCFLSNSRLALLDQNANSILFISDYSVILKRGLPVNRLNDAYVMRVNSDENSLKSLKPLKTLLCGADKLFELVIDTR